MQTIIGSGGAIGAPLAQELKNYTNDIRLVSRNPKKVNDSDQLFPIDVNDFSQLDKSIEGSEIVYIVIGFDYNIKVWRNTWPAFMRAVLDACIKHKSKLVFFDNVYMYDPGAIPFMTEDSPMHPSSKKGIVRKQLVDMIFEEVNTGKLNALISRSADFYGPGNNKSFLVEMAAKNLLKGKKADAFGNVNKIHTYTYTPDAGRATAILGNTNDAYNQVWHVPTTKEKYTYRHWVEMIAKELNAKPGIRVLPNWMLNMIGLFVPIMKEFPEMMYQYTQDYIFDSSKFEKRFGIFATSPEEGIKQMVDALKK